MMISAPASGAESAVASTPGGRVTKSGIRRVHKKSDTAIVHTSTSRAGALSAVGTVEEVCTSFRNLSEEGLRAVESTFSSWRTMMRSRTLRPTSVKFLPGTARRGLRLSTMGGR